MAGGTPPPVVTKTNIYGIEDATLRKIVEDIKLKLIKSINVSGTIPKNHKEYLKEFKTMFTKIDLNNTTLNITPNLPKHTVNASLMLTDTFQTKIIDKTDLALTSNVDIDNLSQDTAVKGEIVYDTKNLNPTRYKQESNTNVIQKRIDGCYILEGLYLNKHNELVKMFDFAKLLYNKFNYTLKLLLYVLSLVTEYNITTSGTGGIGTPITINMPHKIIPNIKTLIEEQNTMLKAINDADTALKSSPLKYDNTTHKTIVKTPLEAATETGILDAINL